MNFNYFAKRYNKNHGTDSQFESDLWDIKYMLDAIDENVTGNNDNLNATSQYYTKCIRRRLDDIKNNINQ